MIRNFYNVLIYVLGLIILRLKNVYSIMASSSIQNIFFSSIILRQLIASFYAIFFVVQQFSKYSDIKKISEFIWSNKNPINLYENKIFLKKGLTFLPQMNINKCVWVCIYIYIYIEIEIEIEIERGLIHKHFHSLNNQSCWKND